ncbi:MAG: serine/threonine protein kinase [Planctomycetes bacterium]|nr:serine/threonine protein kinase [Planctomycetota bacterium]
MIRDETRLIRQASTGGGTGASWDELAVRRLGYVSAVGLVVGVLAGVFSFLRQPNIGEVRSGTERPMLVLPVWIVASGIVLLSTRSRLSARARLDIGLCYLVLISLLVAIFRHWLPYAETDVLRGFSPVVVAILFFAAVVPVHPLRMAIAGAAAATMDGLGLLASVFIEGNPLPGWNLWLWALAPDVVTVPLAVITSRFLYTMGRSLERAREMGSYRLIEKLGEGGMGEVWSARHRMLARPAAVKLIPHHRLAAAGDPDATARLIRRFEREAQATASLQSPHTIEVYDFGVDETGAFFYVMELLDGLSLEELVGETGPLPPGRATRVLLGMCHSLKDAHAHGLIHRDIKPSNVLLCRRGVDFDFVKVLDFGLVKLEVDQASAGDSGLTKDGSLVGSPGYMAPEVLRGLEPTRALDVYAFGCVAFWLLAGRKVFEAPTAAMLFYSHLHDRPDSLSVAAGRPVPESLERLVLRCLEKEPHERPASFEEIERELEATGLAAQWTPDDARSWWASRAPVRRARGA